MTKTKKGRPPKYSDDPEDVKLFAQKIDDYFLDCDKREKPYTIPGLAHYLGFESRFSILNYEGKPAFINTVKKARTKIESQRVENLVSGRLNPAGMIFDLKNNFDYRDKQELELSGEVMLSDKLSAARKRLKK
jgi:hypothetical protein